jgi:uncharacterized membrane protein
MRGKIKMVSRVFWEKPKLAILVDLLTLFYYFYSMLCSNRLSIAEPLANLSLILTLFFSALLFQENIREKIPGTIIILIGGWLLYLNF